MAKKAVAPEVTYKAGEATFLPGEQGIAVSVGGGKEAVVGWAAIARLAAAECSLEQLLARLDTWMLKNRERYFLGMKTGATAKKITALGKLLGQTVPAELKSWLSWHDGQKEDVIGAFRESFNLMSVEQITEAWEERQKAKEPGWNESWIPLLDDAQGDLVVLDPTSPGCAVRELWRGAAEEPIVALSLRGWLAEFVADVESGLYHEDPERGEFHRLT